MTTTRVTVPVEPTQEMVGRAQEFWPDIRDMWSAMLSAAPAVKGPGGYLVKDFADGWYWTPNAALDHASGAPVWSVADGRYETDLPALATREEAPAEGGEDDGLFLLMRRDLYYRPNAMGYTGIKDHAGRYTKAEAESHADPISGVTAIAAIDAPDFSPACFDDLARAHLVGKLEQATRELSALRAQPPAREDAQPVACRFCDGAGWEDDQNWEPRYADVPQEREKGDGLIRCGHCLGDGIDPSPAAHPAPDALRVTGPMAQAGIKHLRSIATVDVGYLDEPMMRSVILAALQAEQKGGAWWLT